MTQHRLLHLRRILTACGLLVLLVTPASMSGEPTSAALSAFNAYVTLREAALAQQHRSPATFLAFSAGTEQRLRRGEMVLEELTPRSKANLPGALLHHWRGTALVAGGRASDFERLLRDVGAYPKRFSPEVVSATSQTQRNGSLHTLVRVRQRHVITVVLDTAYDVSFGQLDPRHRYSSSRSTTISEVDSPGTRHERVLGPEEEHGFLWRQNTYWSYQEQDGGLLLQIESISLSRSVPAGLGWAIRPYVESVPRESLEFTLRSARSAMQR